MNCPFCSKEMMVSQEKKDRFGNVTARSYVCWAHKQPYYQNFHTGDKTKRDTDGIHSRAESESSTNQKG